MDSEVYSRIRRQLTQTRREQHHIQVSHKLLLLRIKHALPRDDIPRHADADDLQNSLEHEEDKAPEIRMRLMAHHDRLLETVESAGREGPADDGGDAIIESE